VLYSILSCTDANFVKKCTLVFIGSDFRVFSLDYDICVFHVIDHEVEEYY
jgi:hypothetical protein